MRGDRDRISRARIGNVLTDKSITRIDGYVKAVASVPVMGDNRNIDWHAATAATLEWWHEAGVDVLVDDLPRDWLAVPVVPSPLPASTLVAPAAPVLPETLAAFLAWRSGAEVPEAGWSGVHLSASGPADAAVMVLVDCPDRDDGQAACLLSGAAGVLFDRMLAAIGLSRDVVHIAAVCAKRPASGRAQREVEERLAELARHHIALVGPKRLLLLGDAASRAILTTNLPDAQGRLHAFNHKGGQTQIVASFHPRFLLEKPMCKAESWRDLRMLVAGIDA